MRRTRWALSVAAVAVSAVIAVDTPAAALPPSGPRECTTDGAAVHEVVVGDTWFGIARAAGVSLNGLLEANGADVEAVIRPGDELCLPAGAAPSPAPAQAVCSDPTYTVILDDSWSMIAKKNKVAMADLLAANGATVETALHPDMGLCLPPGATPGRAAPTPTSCAGASYEVVTDDSWFLIARKSKVSISSLLDVNGATAETGLHPGQTLCLPDEAVVAPSAAPGGLRALPVQGPCWYADSWHAPRGGARRHEGVDLMTKHGNHVYAVADGTLTARAWDQPGARAGNAWWLTAADGTYYFYAHLSDFAPDLKTGSKVVAGQIIGFVGATGNAAGPHLHFEIHPKGGAAVNPYPLVKAAGGCAKD